MPSTEPSNDVLPSTEAPNDVLPSTEAPEDILPSTEASKDAPPSPEASNLFVPFKNSPSESPPDHLEPNLLQPPSEPPFVPVVPPRILPPVGTRPTIASFGNIVYTVPEKIPAGRFIKYSGLAAKMTQIYNYRIDELGVAYHNFNVKFYPRLVARIFDPVMCDLRFLRLRRIYIRLQDMLRLCTAELLTVPVRALNDLDAFNAGKAREKISYVNDHTYELLYCVYVIFDMAYGTLLRQCAHW